MEAAGITLMKWTTHSDQVRKFLHQEQNAASREMAVLQESMVKVLGIAWHPAKGTFSLVMNALMGFLKSLTNTKRLVLDTASRVCDPGGWWMCLWRSVKTTLRRILREVNLSFEEIATVLTEGEAARFLRPLTFIESDISKPCALTAVDLLIGRRFTALPHEALNLATRVKRTDALLRQQYRK
ncbi:hypothetical protein HPB48_021276 [Haemaphysalis longicornis]|uniref:Uncharacterized protein n=1 Tax=Haemaphysalis longicornis TaxID=44386 RepID=A0A9J6GL50_HAELO|nr:hypothetical protein HPB48_021276 [Haemaphysalis longicornis]